MSQGTNGHKIHACMYSYVYGSRKTWASSHFSQKNARIANVFVDFGSAMHEEIDVRLICRATLIIFWNLYVTVQPVLARSWIVTLRYIPSVRHSILRKDSCTTSSSHITGNIACCLWNSFPPSLRQLSACIFCLPGNYQLLFTNVVWHFGHLISIFPLPRGIRIFCLQLGQL